MNATSWCSGFMSGFMFFGICLFGLLIKWPTSEERAEMLKEMEESRMPKVAKSLAHELLDDGRRSEVEKVSANTSTSPMIRRKSSTVSNEELHNEVFGKSPEKRGGNKGSEDLGEDLGEGNPNSADFNATEGIERSQSDSEEEKLEKERLESERVYNDLSFISNMSKTWAKQVGPNALKFLAEFVRVHKTYEANLKTLAQAAETISAIADTSIKVASEEGGEGEEEPSAESGKKRKLKRPPTPQPSSLVNSHDNSESIGWGAISYCLMTAATEQGQMAKTVSEGIQKKYQHLQMEQSHLQSRVEDETSAALKKRSEAKYALEQAKDRKAKAQAAVERLLSSVADSSAPTASKTTTMSGLIKKIGASREVNENKATDQSKKLFKKLQECEIEVKATEYYLEDMISKTSKKLPVFLEDLKLLSTTKAAAVKRLMKGLADALILNTTNIHESSRRLIADIESDSSLGGGFEVLVAEGERGVKEGKFDMHSESLCALIAMKPSALNIETTNKLKEAREAGDISIESAMWLNAFMGRVYRDASSSFKFQNHFEGLMSRAMNKGKKPRYVGALKCKDLKLGQVPPIVKNARYVHPSAMTGADLEHDAAVDMDIMYRGSASAGSDVISFQIETKIWMSKTVFVPIKVTFKLVELSGLLRIGVRKEKSFISFLSNPHIKFNVKSEIGHSLYLKDAPFVERKIVSLVKKAIEKKLVWPSVMKIKLLWPKAWHPDLRGVPDDPESWGKSKAEYEEFLREKKEKELETRKVKEEVVERE
ncbi:hypothetical protein TrLO_g9349, partial [Triparma laevis f. longispina]